MDKVDGNCMGKMKENGEDFDENKSISNGNTMEDNNNSEVKTGLMSTHMRARYYNMTHRKRGLLYIFNHYTFHKKLEQNDRKATDEDVRKVERCFTKLGFDVHIFKDLTLEDIRKHILEAATMDHTNSDCFACFVLSHGDRDTICAYDQLYDPELHLWGQFTAEKCPTLAGKPKMFFMQICQGNKTDSGIKMVHKTRTEFDGQLRSYKIPVQADFLIVYASAPGYYSFRNDLEGAYFVTALCKELEENYIKYNILSILTFVNQQVAIDFESSARKPEYDKKKQAPSFRSTLTRLLLFEEKVSNF